MNRYEETNCRPCALWVDLDGITRNAALLRGTLGEGVQLIAVVKADAYGHGAVPVARAALRGGASMLAVALPEEGHALRKAGIGAPVLVMGPTVLAGAALCAREELAVTAYDEAALRALSDAGTKAGKPIRVHLKVDTGMSRIGILGAQPFRALLALAHSLPGVEPAGVYTHFACADEAQDEMTGLQEQRFQEVLAGVDTKGLLVHAANSAAALRYRGTHHLAVRCGLALYGGGAWASGLPLAPVQRWCCRIAQVKTLPEGEGVSYGATYRTTGPTRVATLPVGYADGYRRCLGGAAQVLIRGQRAPVIGRVCMDMCMVDVTHIPEATQGDEAVLLGRQEGECIPPEELGGWMGSVAYEAMLAPGSRVPRCYLGGSA